VTRLATWLFRCSFIRLPVQLYVAQADEVANNRDLATGRNPLPKN